MMTNFETTEKILERGQSEEHVRLVELSKRSTRGMSLDEGRKLFLDIAQSKKELEDFESRTIDMINPAMPPKYSGNVGRASRGWGGINEKAGVAVIKNGYEYNQQLQTLAGIIDKEAFTESFATRKASAWKPELYRFFERETGLDARLVQANMVRDRYSAYIDGVVVGRDGFPEALVYTTTTGSKKGRLAPLSRRDKARWGMFVTGLTKAYIVVSYQDSEIVIYEYEYDGKVNEEDFDTFLGKLDMLSSGLLRGDVTPPRSDDDIAVDTFKNLTGGAEFRDGDLAGHDYNPEGWVIVDLETTGFNPREGDVIELAYQVLDKHGNVTKSDSILYSPSDELFPVTGMGAVDVHNITVDMVEGRPTFEDAKHEVAEVFKNAPVVVAHYAPFEKEWLENLFGFEINWLDTMRVCKYYCETLDNTLRSFCGANGVVYENAHRALQDVDMTRRALNNFAKNQGMNTL